jgi:peroxin-19
MANNNKRKTAGSSTHTNLDLDAILEQALDDFETLEAAENVKEIMPDRKMKSMQEEQLAAKMAEEDKMLKMLDEMNDPRYGDVVQKTFRDLSGTSSGIQTVNEVFDHTAKSMDKDINTHFVPMGPVDTHPANIDGNLPNADREVAATLKMIAEAQQGMEGFEAGKMEEVGETMMEEMMAQFEALGEKEDYNEVIDGVMRQLLSKDLMYEPTKMICQKFPEWLAVNRPHLSEAEYHNYGMMYQVFQRLRATYEMEPDNFSRLMELMFDMQQYGQPPAEIIKDLAPGLKFDENGMPIMVGMQPGMMPDMAMPGGEGLPDVGSLAGKMASGQCSIQ